MTYRTGNALPSTKKTHSEKHKQIFRLLLKEAPNKTCADCKVATHPRWASWNLGCFVCIRCSGIHRSMGTHISKVKSVDLDAWTDEQVENMVKWGNEKCNSYWEANLPDGYVPDQSKIENFIRTKYDMKKWASSSGTKSSVSKAKPQGIATSGVSGVINVPGNKTSTTSSLQVKEGNLLDDDFFGSFRSASTPAVTTAASLGGPSKSASSVNSSSIPVQLPSNGVPQAKSAQSTGGINLNGRTDLKKSILSLYSSSSATNSGIFQTPANFNNSIPSQGATKSTSSASSLQTDKLSSSILDLNLGSSNSTSTPNGNQAVNYDNNGSNSSSIGIDPKWNHELSNSWSSMKPASKPLSNTTANIIDDDLFKNVWK